jgi:hypothetical protein
LVLEIDEDVEHLKTCFMFEDVGITASDEVAEQLQDLVPEAIPPWMLIIYWLFWLGGDVSPCFRWLFWLELAKEPSNVWRKTFGGWVTPIAGEIRYQHSWGGKPWVGGGTI